MRKLLASALVRGLVWQLGGWLLGAAAFTGLRLLMGLAPLGLFFFTEPAWVFGGFVGVLAFITGSGIADDWFRWAKGESTPEHREDPPGWEKYIGVSLDHKVIGIQYTMASLLLGVVTMPVPPNVASGHPG